MKGAVSRAISGKLCQSGEDAKVKNLKLSVLTAIAIFGATFAQAREAPKQMTLSTGSTLATWTLPADVASGAQARKTPVIYLHGGPGLYTEDRRFDMGQPFRAAGFTTLYYDQLGSGQSARVPATNYTLARMIADLEALRLSIGAEKMVLWGNSWGAQLAALYGQVYPNRVAAFVLTSPGLFPNFNARRDYSLTKRGNVPIGRELTAAVRQIDRKGGAAEASVSQIESGRLLDEITQAELLEGMVCKSSNVGQASLPGGGNLFVNRMVQKEVGAARPDWTRLPRVPTLVVRGACDFIPVTSADRYLALLGGTRVDVPATGHALLEEGVAVERALAAFARDGLSDVK